LAKEKKPKVAKGDTYTFFLLGSQLNEDLVARFVGSSNNFSTKVEW